MAGVAVETAGATVVTPSSPVSGRPNYLKSYPYLFVRETDQTDYFCTVCEESLTEDQLQSHLFETHSAENLQDYFVRVCTGGAGSSKYLYICVVCWAKLSSKQEMHTHRETCKVSFGEDSPDNTMDGIEPDNVVSTPDIPSMMEDDDGIDHRNGVQTNGSSRAASPSFPQPEVILDTDLPGLPATTVTSAGAGVDTKQQLNYSSQCMQCSLCTMILPSSTYLSHLKSYHRVTCPLTSANCPLCMSCVPIMDLTVHLASQHGLVPQSAVNALLLWVLTSNTFALNDSAQASLKSKFRGEQQQQQQMAAMMTSTPKMKSGPQLSSSQSSTSRVKQTPSKAQSVGTVKQEGTLINDMRGRMPIEQIISSLTRSHTGPGGKESHQCLVCSKWYAIPPIKHMRSHITQFTKEKRKVVQLASGASVCLICYKVWDTQAQAKSCVASHSPEGLPGGASQTGGLLAEALMGISTYKRQDQSHDNSDDLPLGATFETPGLKPSSPAPSQVSNNTGEMMNVELDNAGRVKSGKVRKQCELCGEWSNIKWFFKHMSEVHNALFCRCCREYLPIHEHKEHRHWHQMPPYMGQKIRIEDGQPIIIDRKERASLTPIGSLAAWGGSSGGLVVKAVDEIVNRKRKAEKMVNSPSSVKTSGSSTAGDMGAYQLGMLPPDLPAIPTLEDDPGRDSLMPKERCPVCAIEITHKNLARHIKLRHGIRYKFCYKCRKLVPGHLYAEHKNLHEQGQIESVPVGLGDKQLEFIESCKTDDEDDAIEIPEEMLDQALDSNGSRKKDETFRANTSMTKLESLMGKEFKHPRRKCSICGYSVSYSNFKRHLRNAHPGEIGEDPVQEASGDMEMMGHPMDDTDMMSYNTVAGQAPNVDDLEGGLDMKEMLSQQLRVSEGEDGGTTAVKQNSPRPRPIIMRACPECGVEMRSDSIIKHCKLKHKVSYRYCSASAKYVLKKNYKAHLRTLVTNNGNQEEVDDEDLEDNDENDLDTSKDEEDDEMIIDDEGMEEVEEPESKKAGLNKIYNCFDCNRMFMSAEAHANHLRDVHGGEGGSVVLKLPVEQTQNRRSEESDDYEEKADDELVIDDSQ